MNRPIRKVAVALGVLFARAVRQPQRRPGRQGRRATATTRATAGCCSTSTPARAGRSSSRARAIAAVDGDQRRAEVPARLPARARSTRRSPATTRSSTARAASRTAENTCSPATTPGCSRTKLADLLTGRNPRGGSVELTLNKAAQEAAYKAMKARTARQARRGRGARPDDRRDPGRWSRRRPTTRTR